MKNLLSRNRCIPPGRSLGPAVGETERRFKRLSTMFTSHGIRFVRAIDADFYFVSDFPHAGTGRPPR